MARRDDEVGLGKFRARCKRGTNATKEASLSRDRNAMNVAIHAPLHRLGKAKRLIFMAGLTVAD